METVMDAVLEKALDGLDRSESDFPSPAASRPSAQTGDSLFSDVVELARAGKKFHLQLGIKLHQFRTTVPHGEWMEKFENKDERPFGVGKAEKLDRVGECLGILDSPDQANLPSALGTLRLLADLDPVVLAMLIHEEFISGSTKVKDAEALLEQHNGTPKRKPAPSKMKNWLAKLHRLRSGPPSDGTEKEHEAAKAALQEMMGRLAAGKEQPK